MHNGPVPVIEAVGISKRFGATVALRDAGIAVAPGEAHALVGRNGAGKSTLVSILTGLARPDEGQVRFDGQPAPPPGDRGAWRRRVACVYQKSTIISTLSVAENLYLNRQHTAGSLRAISWRRMREEASALLGSWGIDVDPRALAGDLAVEQRQTVEIARALSFGARFIILDEPTAQLDGAGINRLFERLRGLQAAGVAFLFISHHLQEVYEICQTVTVYRDARHVLTSPVAQLGRQALVEAMTGEAVGLLDATTVGGRTGEAVALEVEDLSHDGAYQELSLSVRAGEVVGLAGSAGSGVVAAGETIAGLRRPGTGRVLVDGARVRPGRVDAALAAGIGFVPEDRYRQGLVPLRSVGENLTLTIADRLGRFGFVSGTARRAAATALMRRLDVKAAGTDQPVSALSGGNQQKVVMGRALASEPRVLVLVRPTAGVDVKSKESLLGTVRQAAQRGCAVLMVSDELDDLRAADRVLVMFQGRLVGELANGWTDRQMVAAIEGLSSEEGNG
jgi:simple sugar transport system ATP-binding protein